VLVEPVPVEPPAPTSVPPPVPTEPVVPVPPPDPVGPAVEPAGSAGLLSKGNGSAHAPNAATPITDMKTRMIDE